MKKINVTIIGFGNVGRALLHIFSEKGMNVHSVYNRSGISDQIKEVFLGTTFRSGLPENISQTGDLIFVTVADDAIGEVADKLAERISSFKGKMVVHCSGTHASEVLNSLKEKGAEVASFHPIKAITPQTKTLKGVWFDIEGSPDAVEFLKDLASNIGAECFEVSPEAKPYLHASAVAASNYLVVLADLLSKISALGGVEESVILKAMAPLMENTLQNIQELGATDALTGPIDRADVETIRKHLDALAKSPQLADLYKTFGRQAVDISEQKNGPSVKLDVIKKLLE